MNSDYIQRVNDVLISSKSNNKNICIYGLEKELKKKLNGKLSRLEYYQIAGKRPISAEKSMKLFDTQTVFSNMSAITVNGGHGIKIPKNIDDKLAYVVGWLYGDGGISVHKETLKESFLMHFTNKSKDNLTRVNSIIYNKFGLKFKIRKHTKRNIYQMQKNSILLSKYFHKVFDIPLGKKSGKLNFPKLLKNEKNLANSFIAGFFEADGSVFLEKRNLVLSIKQRSKNVLEDIIKVLAEQNIFFKGPYKNKDDKCFKIVCKQKDSIKKFYKRIPVKSKRVPVV